MEEPFVMQIRLRCSGCRRSWRFALPRADERQKVCIKASVNTFPSILRFRERFYMQRSDDITITHTNQRPSQLLAKFVLGES